MCGFCYGHLYKLYGCYRQLPKGQAAIDIKLQSVKGKFLSFDMISLEKCLNVKCYKVFSKYLNGQSENDLKSDK